MAVLIAAEMQTTNMTFSLNALVSSLMEGKVQQEFPIHLKPTTLCEQCVILRHYTLTIGVEMIVKIDSSMDILQTITTFNINRTHCYWWVFKHWTGLLNYWNALNIIYLN